MTIFICTSLDLVQSFLNFKFKSVPSETLICTSNTRFLFWFDKDNIFVVDFLKICINNENLNRPKGFLSFQ